MHRNRHSSHLPSLRRTPLNALNFSRHMYPSVANVSCSSYQSAPALLSQKVAREVWQWQAGIPRGAGYFLPSPQWSCIPPLIGTVCVGAGGEGRRGRELEWNAVSEEEHFNTIKRIDEASALERAVSPFNELALHVRAQKRAESRTVPGRCSPYEMYEAYPYDNGALGSCNPAHTVRYINSGTATPDHDGSSVHSTDYEHVRVAGSTAAQGIHTPTDDEEARSTSTEALEQELLTDLQLEFSQRIRQANEKRRVKHGQGQVNQLSAHLPPIRCDSRPSSLTPRHLLYLSSISFSPNS